MQREYHPDKASKHDPNGTVQMPEEVDQSDRKTGNGGVDEHGARTDNRRKTISYKSLKTLESHGNEILRRIIVIQDAHILMYSASVSQNFKVISGLGAEKRIDLQNVLI